MNNKITLTQLADSLHKSRFNNGAALAPEIIEEDLQVLQVLIQDREEFPVYVTIDDSQILCVSYLWQEQEIIPEQREALLEALLALNIPMPLSSFSKIGHQYIIFGALSTRSDADAILHEIETLSDNTLDAIELMADYLK
ncbi:DUF2170 family protein [Methylobacter sp. BBA5.1]|uniref:DUF2170 family protein n=1 Tax=Methylobacter sp. BBA5.1 TaxID=1495064 RepID=UPI0006904B65|nr:DUF2170 family protein [Methylobacter sp. BBA5.1]